MPRAIGRRLCWPCGIMLIAQAIVGVIHFTFHLTAFVDGPEATR
jgi:hypothetical protein